MTFNHKFIYIDVGTNGRASDGGIFGECSLVRAIEHQDNPLGIPPSKPLPGRTTDTPFVILGDDDFPLKSYVMKPYKKKTKEHKEKIYNYRQSRGRLVVENAFGITTTRFRILLKQIDLKLSKVETIWCCCLHNMLTKESDYSTTDNIREKDKETLGEVTKISGNRNSEEARNIRNEFAEYFSNEGCIDHNLSDLIFQKYLVSFTCSRIMTDPCP